MISLRLSISKDDARTVLETPEIRETISEDGVDSFELPDQGHIYLCGYVRDELIGCFILHKQSKVTFECHVQVLPEFRKDYAEQFGDAVIEWTWENTSAEKIVAQIPFLYPNVRDFALARGFKVEGVNGGSYFKNDQIHNQWYLGIRRWDS